MESFMKEIVGLALVLLGVEILTVQRMKDRDAENADAESGSETE